MRNENGRDDSTAFDTTATPLYSQFIHLSRYSRWLDSENRRETWSETVDRYINFFSEKHPAHAKEILDLFGPIHSLSVMPSMRCLMTAGPALERDHVSGYNCSYCVVDSPRAFDEIMYVLMCFHPDTLVKTTRGAVEISKLLPGDEVLSFDESTKNFCWKPVVQVVQTPSAHKDKVRITLENGTTIQCTSDHTWLTENRGWVMAGDLTEADDLVAPKFQVYKVTSTITGKAYVGYTSKNVRCRFDQHVTEATGGLRKYASHFHNAIVKYGKDAWTLDILDYAYTQEEATAKERHIISTLATKTLGYNSTDGGEGTVGSLRTEEQRARMSATAYTRTDAHREAARARIKQAQPKINATRQTPEYREAQRLRNIGEHNPQFGKKLSDERKDLLREQNLGEKNAFYGRSHSAESLFKMKATKAANANRETVK